MTWNLFHTRLMNLSNYKVEDIGDVCVWELCYLRLSCVNMCRSSPKFVHSEKLVSFVYVRQTLCLMDYYKYHLIPIHSFPFY
jgi:hypothetical protein